MYLSRYLSELGFPAQSPVQIATDNSGARDLSYNPEHHDRVKHVERRHFYIRELVEEKSVVVPFVSTHDNIADFFTKPLAGKNFYRLRNVIMNVTPEDRAHASLARRAERVRRRARRDCMACGGSGLVKDEDCFACEIEIDRVRRASRRVRFSCRSDAPSRDRVRRTGGCRKQHTSLPSSRVVAPLP